METTNNKQMKVAMLANYLMNKELEGSMNRFEKMAALKGWDNFEIIMDTDIFLAANKLLVQLDIKQKW